MRYTTWPAAPVRIAGLEGRRPTGPSQPLPPCARPPVWLWYRPQPWPVFCDPRGPGRRMESRALTLGHLRHPGIQSRHKARGMRIPAIDPPQKTPEAAVPRTKVRLCPKGRVMTSRGSLALSYRVGLNPLKPTPSAPCWSPGARSYEMERARPRAANLPAALNRQA